MASSMDIDQAPGTQDAPHTTQPDPNQVRSSSLNTAVEHSQQKRKLLLRKRTKTGCLTCRKRRIKCDENKPICLNCVKSKRPCEGYNQRLTFKEPLGHFMPYSRTEKNPAIAPSPIIVPNDAMLTIMHERNLRPIADPPFSSCPTIDNIPQYSPVSNAQYSAAHIQRSPSYVWSDTEGDDDQSGASFMWSDAESDDDQREIPPNSQNPASILLNGLESQLFGLQKAPETSLTTYHPSLKDSPLTNPVTAKVFWHFFNVVAPTISLYESSGVDDGRFALVEPLPVAIPYAASAASIWRESFSLMSVHHPALLQAILALSSLHLAKMQGLPPIAAMKHYHLALRRTARNVQDPLTKTHSATAACLLLLGYFQVWMSDFEKWRSHLSALCPIFNHRESVDAGAVVGRATESSFQVHRPGAAVKYVAGPKLTTSGRGPEEFEQLREIYWSLFRMDVYQSFLGGAPPLLARPDTQSDYPPRAAIGDLTTIHGTLDHLFLLLRRVADFAIDEKNRRGHHGDMGHPNIVTDDGLASQQEEAQRVAAGAANDWSNLLEEFKSFQRALGGEYQHLEDGSSTMDSTGWPLRPGLRFRSYAVAGIWMNFYMGLILLHRANPSLPPGLMLAVGFAAKDTAPFVDHICRTIEGLTADLDLSNTTAVHPVHAAALIESCLPLLTAGLQMRHMEQRQWLIRYLLDIERLTGCQFARHVKDACESCWMTLAAFRRGPPYNKTLADVDAPLKSVWQNVRNLGPEMKGEVREMRLVLHRYEQNYYAFGLMTSDPNELGFYSVERDLTRLDLRETAWEEEDAIIRRQQIADKKGQLLVLERKEDVRIDSTGPKSAEISPALAAQVGELSSTAVEWPKSPARRQTEELGGLRVSRMELCANNRRWGTSIGNSSSEPGTDDSSWSVEETDDDSQASRVQSEAEVNPETRVLNIIHRNKRKVVREVAQYWRKAIGNRQLQNYNEGDGDNNGEGPAPKGSFKQTASNSLSRGRDGGNKRQSQLKTRRGRDGDDREGDENGKRRPNKKAKVSTENTAVEGLKLACPYFKRNPNASRIGQSCAGPGWNTIHRLKEHLYRRHVCVRCLRCSASFHTNDDLVTHSRAATACTVSCATIDPDDGFEKHQEALLRRRWKVVTTTEEQWRQVYKILFPEDSEDLMPSPYYQDHRTMTDEFARFELFLRRETSRLLEERLNESLLYGSTNMDPASFAGQLSNVVNEIQAEAIRSYRNSSQVELGGFHQEALGQEGGSQGGSDRIASVSSPFVQISEILATAPDPNLSRVSSTLGEQAGSIEGRSSDEMAEAGNDHELGSWYDLSLSTDFDFGNVDEAGDWTREDWEFPSG